MRTIIRRLVLTFAALAMAAGMTGAVASAASASPPPVTNHCGLWANPDLHKLPLFCLANETPADLHPHF